MNSAVKELDRLAEVCAGLDLGASESGLACGVVEPVAALVGAETASLRRFGLGDGALLPQCIVDIAIPASVKDAYLDRYFLLDPVRRLLARSFAKPLFAHPSRRGEWSAERATPPQRAHYREEFRRYRREFLLPNRFHHHVGFCVRTSTGDMITLDFHRPRTARDFSELERARARVVACHLHAQAGASASTAMRATRAEVDAALTTREAEVADAVTTGMSNKQIGEHLGISVRTVENHLRSVFAKLGVATRMRLAARLRAGAGDA